MFRNGTATRQATEQCKRTAIDIQQRHQQAQRYDARKHQELDRRDAKCGERVDLFIALHRRDTGGEAGAGTTGKNHPRQYRGQLARRCDADEVCDVDAGTEGLELHGAYESEDGPHQDIDHAHDEQRAAARLRQHIEHLAGADLGAAGHESRQQKHDLSEQPHEGVQVARALQREHTHTRDNAGWRRRYAGAAGRLGTRKHEQLVQVLGQPLNGDFPLWCVEPLHDPREEGSVRNAPAPFRRVLNTQCAHSSAFHTPEFFQRARQP